MIVAPYVGAWIETWPYRFGSDSLTVAPYVGAWIETWHQHRLKDMETSHPTWVRGLKPHTCTSRMYDGWSHPTWVRGLKLSLSVCKVAKSVVAPYVGAWIETLIGGILDTSWTSHPTWVRGLKRFLDTSWTYLGRRTLRGCVV